MLLCKNFTYPIASCGIAQTNSLCYNIEAYSDKLFTYLKYQLRLTYETLQPDGTLLRHAGRISGDPRAVQIIRNEAYNKETFSELITENIIPKEIQVISHNDAGIAPYNFLELKEE